MPGIRYKWRSKENCAHIWGFRPPRHLNGRWTFALQSAVFGAGGRAPISPYLGAVGRAAASSWTTASGHLAGQHGSGLGGAVLAAARRCSRWRRHLVDRHLYKRASIILETQRVAAVGGDDTWWIGTLPQRVAAVGGDNNSWIGTSTSVPISSWRPLVHGLQCLGANLHRGARGARCGRVLGSGCQFHSGATSRVASKALVA